MSTLEKQEAKTDYMSSDSTRLRELFDFATLLNQQTDFTEILRIVTRKSAELLSSEMSVILMLNPKTRQTVKTIHREARGGEKLYPG
jgi:hypothetical protein